MSNVSYLVKKHKNHFPNPKFCSKSSNFEPTSFFIKQYLALIIDPPVGKLSSKNVPGAEDAELIDIRL